jgi:bifunctional N-acetylglucosamine-1-phosphate-uridyltransferase/glucosamine-1-phosphate-acetyltransferase GlmU-like protein
VISSEVLLVTSTAAFPGQDLPLGTARVVFGNLVAFTVASVLVFLNDVPIVTPKSIKANRLKWEMAFLATRFEKVSMRLGQLTCADLSLARCRE